MKIYRKGTFANTLEGAELKTYPWPYVVIDDFFDHDFYNNLIKCLPPKEVYPSDELKYQNSTGVEVFRNAFALEKASKYTSNDQFLTICSKLLESFNDPLSLAALFRLFPLAQKIPFSTSCYVRSVFSYDKPGYSLRPHTDVLQKLFTLLFYLPKDDAITPEGTAILLPKVKGFRSDGFFQYPFEDFNIVDILEFRPNRVLVFQRTDSSWHSKPKTLSENRYMLQCNYNMRIENDATSLIKFWKNVRYNASR